MDFNKFIKFSKKSTDINKIYCSYVIPKGEYNYVGVFCKKL